MTRRNQKKYSTRNQKFNDNEQRLVKKLDLRKLNYFRYDAKEVFFSTDLEQRIWNPLCASIVTKASRISIKDAKEYINNLEEEKVITKETAIALIQLLDKYKRWR
jgi:hypothetical protein